MSHGAEVDAGQLERELKKIGRRVEDFSPITPVLAEILVGYVNEEWDSAGRGRWPGLADSTLKKRRGTSAEILKDTGRAAADVHGEHDHESAAAVTSVSYMVFHTSDQPRKIVPLRNPFDVMDAAEVEIAETLSEWVAGGG